MSFSLRYGSFYGAWHYGKFNFDINIDKIVQIPWLPRGMVDILILKIIRNT